MTEKFMELAIKEANKALLVDEVPIGAIIVKDGKVIARAFNLTESKQSATAHAEMLAIQKACKKLKSWRLDGCELFVTLEPCAMCAGAIVGARIDKVFFGAYEPKSGCAESLYPILSNSGLNHTVQFEGGILKDKCSKMLKDYFKFKRTREKKRKSIDY